MMHTNRSFSVTESTVENFIHWVKTHTLTLCSGFQIEHLVFLNDSSDENSLQEYAVIDSRSGKQIESITVSWIEADQLREMIQGYLDGSKGCDLGMVKFKVHPKGGDCRHCR